MRASFGFLAPPFLSNLPVALLLPVIQPKHLLVVYGFFFWVHVCVCMFLLAGANGMGKTTTIGKLANRLRVEGNQTVMIAACDTFR